MKVNEKPVMIRDTRAIKLAKRRAKEEHRSIANAAAVSIIEALDGKSSKTYGDEK